MGVTLAALFIRGAVDGAVDGFLAVDDLGLYVAGDLNHPLFAGDAFRHHGDGQLRDGGAPVLSEPDHVPAQAGRQVLARTTAPLAVATVGWTEGADTNQLLLDDHSSDQDDQAEGNDPDQVGPAQGLDVANGREFRHNRKCGLCSQRSHLLFVFDLG